MSSGGDRVQVFEFASPVTRADLDRFVEAREQALNQEQRHGIVVVADKVTRIPSGAGIYDLVRWNQRRKRSMERHVAGIAFVLPWTPLAKVVRSLMSMVEYPTSSLYTDSLDEALDWTASRVVEPDPDRFD